MERAHSPERTQLRPLLAEAPYHAGAAVSGFEDVGNAEVQSNANEPHSALGAQALIRTCDTLPAELMSRLLSCVDPQTREAVLDALPRDRHMALVQPSRVYAMTGTARAALLEAASTSLEQPEAATAASASKPANLGQKIRAWLGRKV